MFSKAGAQAVPATPMEMLPLTLLGGRLSLSATNAFITSFTKKFSAMDGLSLNQVFFLHFLNRPGHCFISHFCQWKAVPLNPSKLSCWNRAEFAAFSFPLPLTWTKSAPRKKNYGIWWLWPYHWVRLYWSVSDSGSLGSTTGLTGGLSV